tara:strand:- start:13955 stop:14176 length:222 start_codon:yes stop_codon:yes gene_type:complete
MKLEDEFFEARGIMSLCSHERTTLVVFEDYEGNALTVEIPTEDFLCWFDTETMKHACETYTNHLKKKVYGNEV